MQLSWLSFDVPLPLPGKLLRTGNVLFFISSLLALLQVGFSDAKNQQKQSSVTGKDAAILLDSKGNWLMSGDWPTFDLSGSENVTAERGQTGFLPCSIINQGSHVISWIRKNKHFTIISIGDMMFNQDERFSIPHGNGLADWSLRIAQLKPGDAGIYECQIGTSPKSGRHIRLHVGGEYSVRAMPTRRNHASGKAVPLADWIILLASCLIVARISIQSK